MSAGVACLALALLVLPPSAARRRRAVLFGGPAPHRLPPHLLPWLAVAAALVASAAIGPGALIAAASAAATLGVRRRRATRDRRRDNGIRALLDGLEVIIGELRVGAHPSAAAAAAGAELDGAAARAFTIGSARSRLGGSAAEGLRAPGTPIAAELSRIADAWQVAERHGLALAELLAAARADLLARKRFRDRTAAALAGPRATGAVLAALPLLGIALGQALGAQPLRVLFDPGLGTLLLPLGTALACAGLLWTDAITRGNRDEETG
ncbi:type II secretion system F family protein [Nocardia terpenica]|uniref:type II secretion system F family protein n=1 Tax=Nocardia terpenica TaxID=455432 RepID=UPI001894CCDE|nr:type II secretion system F family protein [Nocardia terpenica]MBF6062501.1 type II secretion system F family protein [Nocardia terpenica]MBF6104589.1 type II secretion system F family protein [Nocardia terpenica]MBF6109556.1 type II secretion system F family protein [Nocardia terpenica]MBF6119861.1 type II secretion system F family protein [Nocardia terpenica]MBF6152272.1 type II secretion system F family protein [Nocardia terpenica]